jgi:hypothetical protein
MKNSTLKPDEDIGLKLSDDMKQRDYLLLYHDSEPYCREPLEANATTQLEKLEHPCERITDDYRGGGGNERLDPPAAHGWRRLHLSRCAEERTRYSLTFKRDQVTKLAHHD